MKWSEMKAVLAARRAGATLGDIAVMKFDIFSGPAPRLNAQLKASGDAEFVVDVDALRRMPEGTVGRAYARHLDDHGLAPLEISEAYKRRYADRPAALRYTTTHDLFHTLTGFTTTPAGEIGLFAFMIGQGFAAGGMATLRLAKWVYALFMPTHAPGVWHNARVGLALGGRALNLLEQPLESLLSRPLLEVRRELGLPEDPARAGIVAGHDSWLARLFVVRPKQVPAAA